MTVGISSVCPSDFEILSYINDKHLEVYCKSLDLYIYAGVLGYMRIVYNQGKSSEIEYIHERVFSDLPYIHDIRSEKHKLITFIRNVVTPACNRFLSEHKIHEIGHDAYGWHSEWEYTSIEGEGDEQEEEGED